MDRLEAAEHLSHLENTIRCSYGYDRDDYDACALGSRALVRLDTFLEESEHIRAALAGSQGEWERRVERAISAGRDARFAEAKVEHLRSALSALERLEELG